MTLNLRAISNLFRTTTFCLFLFCSSCPWRRWHNFPGPSPECITAVSTSIEPMNRSTLSRGLRWNCLFFSIHFETSMLLDQLLVATRFRPYTVAFSTSAPDAVSCETSDFISLLSVSSTGFAESSISCSDAFFVAVALVLFFLVVALIVLVALVAALDFAFIVGVYFLDLYRNHYWTRSC